MGNSRASGAKVADAACGDAKVPRTERGRRTLRKLLDAAAEEFGEKGFHEASVSSITRRAGVALGKRPEARLRGKTTCGSDWGVEYT